MPRRPRDQRTIHCPIACASVHVTLRHGRAWQDAGVPYVRCEERDCQYVDTNEPPCPLRVELFLEESDDAIRRHLEAYPGHWVCYACIEEAIQIRPAKILDTIRRLARREARLEAKVTRCESCRQRRRAARVTADVGTGGEGAMDVGEYGALVQALRSAPDVSLCPSCLAFVADRPLGESRRLGATLARDSRLLATRARCTKCGRVEAVISGRADGETIPAAD
jgi:hypothetical protein